MSDEQIDPEVIKAVKDAVCARWGPNAGNDSVYLEVIIRAADRERRIIEQHDPMVLDGRAPLRYRYISDWRSVEDSPDEPVPVVECKHKWTSHMLSDNLPRRCSKCLVFETSAELRKRLAEDPS